MSTTQNTITEADVLAFLQAKAAAFAAAIGSEYVSIGVDILGGALGTSGAIDRNQWRAYVDKGGSKIAPTLDEAIAAQVSAMAPENRAKTLREQAAAMLAEAEQIQNGRAA